MTALVGALLAVFGLVGCLNDRGDKPVILPEQSYLDAPDQLLPAGIVGTPYDAAVTVAGGEPPYVWVVADDLGLPAGLELSTDGHIAGTPAEAGSFSFALLTSDSAGRAKRVTVSLTIVLEPTTVQCGDTVRGSFVGNAYTADGPDLTKFDSLAWLAVDLPDDLTTRVELAFDASAVSTLYVERPAEDVGSSNLDDHYVPYYLNPGFTDMTVPIDAGTVPSLTGYATQALLPMVLVAQSPGDWEMTVVCTDGPVFVDLAQYPTELGQPLLYDYQVYGDNAGVRIWTEDPLPDWMIWDESTGVITGTAAEPGAWEFTVIAETADGRRREERTILGVYAVTDLTCGSSIPLEVEEGYFDGEFYAYYDPRGYSVYRIPLDAIDPSAITLEVTGSDGHYLGLSDPAPDWLKFYGGAERLYLNTPVATIDIDPATYPAVDHFEDAGELYFSAGTIGTDRTMTVTVTCDEGPRANLAALPVIQPLGEADAQFEAIGGTAPYGWSATGLPAGLILDPDGHLHGQSGAIGTYTVDLTVEDKLGASDTRSYTMYVGNDEACAPYRKVTCGGSIDGEFTAAYYNDANGPASTRTFCIVNDDDQALGYEIYSDDGELRVDVADPGASDVEMFDEDQGTFVSWVDRDSTVGVPIDPYSWPDLDDYPDLPVLLSIRAYNPGSWTVHVVCE
ncbi:MAG: Ig domain-containing protein [Myxococcota bacterium]